MIKEAYCSEKVSEMLKKKGFDEPCMAFWDYELSEYSLYISSESPINNSELEKEKGFKGFSAPTHQMATAWLREKKYISIVITDDEIPLSYKYIIRKYFINDKYNLGVEVLKLDSTQFIKYADAVESALKYSLENLI